MRLKTSSRSRRCTNMTHCFVAVGVEKVTEQHFDEHECLTNRGERDAGDKSFDYASLSEMHFSCRVTSDESAERIKSEVEKATGLEVILPRHYRRPVVTDPENAYVKTLFEAMKAKWPEKNIRLTRMSCATDATRYLHLHLPAVIFGATGGETHAAVEWVSLKSIENYTAMFTEYLLSMR